MKASYMPEEEKWRTKNAYTKHMYTFWKVFGSFIGGKRNGRKLNKKRVECYERKILSKKRTEVQTEITYTECL